MTSFLAEVCVLSLKLNFQSTIDLSKRESEALAAEAQGLLETLKYELVRKVDSKILAVNFSRCHKAAYHTLAER